eukprot:362306-Chlamydomonas_euryale.AAC.6
MARIASGPYHCAVKALVLLPSSHAPNACMPHKNRPLKPACLQTRACKVCMPSFCILAPWMHSAKSSRTRRSSPHRYRRAVVGQLMRREEPAAALRALQPGSCRVHSI